MPNETTPRTLSAGWAGDATPAPPPADGGFAAAREQVKAALAAMGRGDPQPYIDRWAASDDVTLFGAWGPIERGTARLTETFRWVGSRFSGGPLVPEDAVAFASGDLAYTVGFERGEVAVDGGPVRPMTLRVTHIYRRVDGAWRLVHRHADFPPQDQRPGMRAPRPGDAAGASPLSRGAAGEAHASPPPDQRTP